MADPQSEQKKPPVMTPTQAKVTGAALGGGALIALAFSLATPMVEKWEGTKLNPYKDVIGVWTVCTGETRVKMRRYTPVECNALLTKAIKSDFAPAVLRAVPGLKNRPYQFAASISLTLNIGPGAFAKSSIARHFNAGRWREGCNGFPAWNKAGGKVWTGLVRRREDERKLCLTDLPT